MKVFKENNMKIKNIILLILGHEGNYNSFGVDLDIATLCRTKYAEFNEYHTSADNFNVFNKKRFYESYIVMIKIINKISKI